MVGDTASEEFLSSLNISIVLFHCLSVGISHLGTDFFIFTKKLNDQ